MSALSPDLLEKMDAYWRAANYLSVGQIYLRDNPTAGKPARAQAHQAPLARTPGRCFTKAGPDWPSARAVDRRSRARGRRDAPQGLADKTGSTSSRLARPKPIIFCSRLGRNILYPDLSGPPSARNSGIPLREIIGIFPLQLRGYQFAIEHAEVTSHADADTDSKSRRFLQASGGRNSSRGACGQGTAPIPST